VTDWVGIDEERRRNLQSSGDELQWPGGAIWRGSRGEMEREVWGLNSRGRGVELGRD
jgi:hypothetical protein